MGDGAVAADGEIAALRRALAECEAEQTAALHTTASAETAADLTKIEQAARDLGALVAARFLPPEPVAPAETPAPEVAHPTGAVLVVDDNEMNRDMLSRRLARLGHPVLTADGGRQALDLMRAERIDLVLLDIMMPEMDGYAVLEARRADDALSEIPVIVISAVDDIESAARCITLGADDYLTKPFNPVILRARVDACLERKRRGDREADALAALARLTASAAAFEAGAFAPGSLADLEARPDAIGGLARVMARVAQGVRAREEELRAQLRERSYVFLSYARADRDRVEALVETLEAAGVRVWLDRHDIAGGASWSAQIVQSIRGCAALLVACSRAALDSRNVRQEIGLAWKHGRPYVPLILEPVDFPDEVAYHLEGWQWVDVLDRPAETWMPSLLQALHVVGLEPGGTGGM